jgi:hypothetical protein
VIEAIVILSYLVTVLVAGRVVYTKHYNSEWFVGADDEPLLMLMAIFLWPAAFLVWAIVRFVTGGVRK